MSAGVIGLDITVGADWSFPFIWALAGPPDKHGVPTQGSLVDNTGCTAVFTIARYQGGPALLTLTESSGITLGGTDGSFLLHAGPGVTGLLTGRRAVHSLFVTPPGGAALSLLSGPVKINPV